MDRVPFDGRWGPCLLGLGCLIEGILIAANQTSVVPSIVAAVWLILVGMLLIWGR